MVDQRVGVADELAVRCRSSLLSGSLLRRGLRSFLLGLLFLRLFDFGLFHDGLRDDGLSLNMRDDRLGRGLAHRLLAFAGQWLAQQGFACLTTVPARPDLHPFFASNGFAEGYTMARSPFVPNGGACARLVPVDAAQYNTLRRTFLSGRGYVDYSDDAMAYQQTVSRLSGGGLYRVDEGGCACVELGGDTGFVKELLVDPNRRQAAANALTARHPAARYELRTPWPGEGERVPFAMYKWLGETPEDADMGPDDYLGLAFD